MKKIITLVVVCLLSLTGSFAQSSCNDWNEYVDYKNTGGTGFYTLVGGAEEKASQTYHYSGPGNVTSVSLYGGIPVGIGGSVTANIKVSIYNVDVNNRPTTLVSPSAMKSLTWFFWEGNRTVSFAGGGIAVNSDFAIVVEFLPFYDGHQFQIKYTGDGEGLNEDLPSTAGTSTGGNWTSLLPADDGDLYIIPKMKHFIEADFTVNKKCNVDVGQTLSFTNMTSMTMDKMFNTIALPGYTGTETFYSWDFGDGNGGSTLQNPTYSYSTPGKYTVTLTSTLDNWPMGGSACSDTKTMDISVGLSVEGSTTNLTCNDDNSGEISLSALGGDNSNYKYSLDGVNWQSSSSFSGLESGTYSVYVQDGLGCIEPGASVTVTEPGAIVISSPVGVTFATCGNADGALLASAFGGTGALEYSLDNITYQPTGSFTGLTGGNYMVYAKDANGCVEDKNVVIDNTNSPSLSLLSYTNVSCKSGNDGTIILIGSGGTGALQYSIDGINFQANGNFTSVSAGSYSPSVKDAAGCIGSLVCVTSCDVKITEPTEIEFSLSEVPATCNGSSDGQIDVFGVIGGTGTTTYSLDGVNFQSGSNFSGLMAGSYTVTAKDAANCTQTRTISISEPGAIIASVDFSSNLSCNESSDGALTISATGGNNDYWYSLDGNLFYPTGDFVNLDAGDYLVTVQDDKGCMGSISQTLTEPLEIDASITTGNSTCGNANGTLFAAASGGSGAGYTYSIDGGATSNGTGTFSGLVNNVYLVLVTDDTGCEKVFVAIVSDSDGPTITNSTFTDVTCNGGNDGTVTITSVTGGSGVIEYSADGGTFQTSNILTGLTAGQHTIVAKDANGCTGELTVNLIEPPAFTIVLTSTDINCYGANDGTITVGAAGGSGALAYSVDGINFQSSTTLTNLGAGVHVVTVRDAGGCIASDFISIAEPDMIKMTTSVLNVTCSGANNGVIYANATGGSGSFTYKLDNGSYQSSGSFTGVDGGLHLVSAKDGANCVTSQYVVVYEPQEMVLSSTISHVSCSGGDDGVIDLEVSGGTFPYVYTWSNFLVSQDAFNLSAANYSVSVVDGNGCTKSDNFIVYEPSNPIVVNGITTNASGASVANGSVDVTITGGTAPYSYAWSNGVTMEDNSSLIPGVYSIIVTDANGCTSTAGFTITWNVGISDNEAENTVNIYPNPVSDILYVEITGADIVEGVVLINMIGETVYKAASSDNKFEIDVTSLSNGIYFINIQSGNDIITKKIVINK